MWNVHAEEALLMARASFFFTHLERYPFPI